VTFAWLFAAALAADPTPVALANGVSPALAEDRLHLEVQAQIRLDEGKLLVQTETRLLVDEPGVVQLAQLAVPLLVPIVAGVPLDDGALPAQGQSVEVEAEGGLKVERSHGAVVVRGSVSVGQPALVRVRYFVPFRAASVQLGLRGGPGPTGLAVAVQAQGEARVRLASDRPHRLTRFEQAGERLVGWVLSHPLRPGEVVSLVVDDLPGPPRRLRESLLVAVLLAGLAVLAWVMRRASSRAGRG
jgi:hypothetical protein